MDIVDEPGSISTLAVLLASKGINIKNIGINHSREEGEGALRISFYNQDSETRAYELLKKSTIRLLNRNEAFHELSPRKKHPGLRYSPGDKSISHRSVMLGSIARGTTEMHGFLEGADCLSPSPAPPYGRGH